MMKKSLLFILPSLCSGGAERSLITLLTLLDQTGEYDMDLLLFRKEGLFLPSVPSGVTVLSGGERYAAFDGSIGGAVRYGLTHLEPSFALNRLLYAKALQKGNRKKIWDMLKTTLPKIKKEYDTAIGYLEGNALYFCAECVKAKTKIGYIHNDYSKLGLDADFDRPFVEKLDAFVTVSPECEKVLREVFPEAAQKIHMIENITSPSVLRSQAEKMPSEFESISCPKLLTIGRLREQKGYDFAVAAAEKLKQDGFAFKWFCIGTGELKEQIEREICEKNLEENLILLGERTNPYPYIAHCDLYVQPSHYEGKSIALDETKCFAKPIVATKFTTVFDQLTDGKTALLAEMSGDSIAEKIEALIQDEALRKTLTENLQNEEVGNEAELKKFTALTP
ncbi:MAG TPA: glycosyltransferase [Ruminococcaceae bacterium]|nr:glycosyltransferase [Oscillospiraceae bacterium]